MVDRAVSAPRSAPWLDRRGAFSPLKAIVFAGVLAPGLWLIERSIAGTLGPRQMIEINHQAGLWALRFLILTLAATPLRHVWRWPELVFVRRQFGVAVFAYAAIHLVAYAGDMAWDIQKVISEIFARIYLTIGFAALIMLLPLAITSTNGMMKRMGGIQWRALHRLTYLIVGLGAVHFFLQSKLGVTEPIVIAACATWLLVWRFLAAWLGEARISTLPATAALAVAMIVGTAFAEAMYYHLKIGVALSRILPTNWIWKAGIRPAWIIALIAAALVAVAIYRILVVAKKPRANRRQAGASATKPASAPQRQGNAA